MNDMELKERLNKMKEEMFGNEKMME